MMYKVVNRKEANIPNKFITGYFVAGFPSKGESIDILEEAVNNGVNVIELGFPSRNPYLDGDTIKQAHQKSVDYFPSIDDFIQYVGEVRERVSVPIWIMGYKADLLDGGEFLTLAQSSYVDGFVIPDLPLEEMTWIQRELQEENVTIIPVINNKMTDDDILSFIAHNSMVYCQLYAGKTGSSFMNTEGLPAFYERMRGLTDAKLMAGFGIKNSTIAQEIFQVGYDGIVIGSEFVRLLTENKEVDLYKSINLLVKTKEM